MKTWEMVRTVYSVGDFVTWQKSGSLVLSPSFQRRPVWKPGAKSFLIDTVLRGLPIPIIFLRDRKTNLKSLKSVREVVDGQQRLRTLISFIAPSILEDYSEEHDNFSMSRSHSKELAGKKFPDFPSDMQQRLLDYQFSVHVMPSGVDDREVLQIFARMNSTGIKLNDQELRNAEYFGDFKTSIYEIAAEQLTRWRNWGVFSEYELARMEEVELTSEFALLMIRGLSGKTQNALDSIYSENDETFANGPEVTRRFRHMMDLIDGAFGEDLRNLPFARKTLFYSLFAALYSLSYDNDSVGRRAKPRVLADAIAKKIKAKGELIRSGRAPKSVLDASARRTTHLSSRQELFKYLTRV